ncbi:MAG: hypothetical protein V1701_01730 [Planctomycetota bacterium]
MEHKPTDELEQLGEQLRSKLFGYPVLESLPAGFMEGVRQKIRIRQRQRLHRWAVLASAAVILLGIGLSRHLMVKNAPEAIPPQPQAQINEFDANLARMSVPPDTDGKIKVFSQIIGAQNFTLSFNRTKDELTFVASDKPAKLIDKNNHWEAKLQKVLDKCFLDAKELTCIVVDGRGKNWSILE